MIIRAIRLDNFGLYAGQQLIQPTTAIDGQEPITLVGGLNGRGKTSLLEAVLLNLYGSRSPVVRDRDGAYTAYLDSLIHKGADRSAGSSVELDVDIPGEGNTSTHLRIRRSWRVTNKRAVERLEVWRDGLADGHLATNWNSYVEDLVPSGLSWLFFFDGEKIAALAEEEDTSESLRVAIQSLLGLDLVDKLIGDLDAVIKRHRAVQRKSADAVVVDRLEADLSTLRHSEREILQEIASKENEVGRAQKELNKREQVYFTTGGTLAQSRAELEKEQIRLRGQMAQFRSDINNLAAGPLPLLLVAPLLNHISGAVDAANQVQQAKAMLPLMQKRDSLLLSKLAEYIPDFTKLNNVADFLMLDRAELVALAAQEPAIQLSAVGVGQLANLLGTVQQELRDKVETLSLEYGHILQAEEQVNRHLLFQFDQDKMTASLEEVSQAAQDLAHKKQERAFFLRSLEELTGQIKAADQKYKAAFEKYMEQLDELDDAKRTISIALRSQETMRTFRRHVTEKKIHALEAAVTSAFHDLTHKSDLASFIRIHPETLHITMQDSSGQNVLKSRLSSGEKQMLAVSILWGLARASGRELPVIIDTPLARLDSSHRMSFLTRYLPNASHQVIVLSTDTEIVGPYLQSLNGVVGRQYLLQYDEKRARTTVEPGYFSGEKGARA